MNTNPDIVFLGEIGIDFYSADSGYSLAESGGFLKKLGGTSAKIAATCALLGLRVSFAGEIAGDSFGKFIQTTLKEKNIYLIKPETQQTSEKSILYFYENDENSGNPVVYHPGSLQSKFSINKKNLAGAGALCLSDFQNADESRWQTFYKASHIVKESGGKLILNLFGNEFSEKFIGEFLPLLKKADFVFGTAEQFRSLSVMTGEEKDNTQIITTLTDRNSELILVKDGDFGHSAYTSMNSLYFPAYHSKRTNRFIGNEAFIGGVLFGLFYDFVLSKAVKYGTVCEALVSSRMGGVDSLPNLLEIEEFLQTKENQIATFIKN